MIVCLKFSDALECHAALAEVDRNAGITEIAPLLLDAHQDTKSAAGSPVENFAITDWNCSFCTGIDNIA